MEQVQQEKSQLSGMQAALLQRAMEYDNEADAMSNPPPEAAAEEIQITRQSNTEIIATALKIAAAAAAVNLPEVKEEITPNMLEQAAAGWGGVCDHYGIDLSGYMGNGGVMICASAVMSTWPLIEAVKGIINKRKQQAAEYEQKQPITAG